MKKPVIIIGAPRSGTSLLQRILRGAAGFVSVPKESAFIWEKFTHPELHDWIGEKWCPDQVSDADVARVRECFSRHALPANIWREFDKHKIGNYQRSRFFSSLLTPAYKALAAIHAMTIRENDDDRLVDKSVHSALWLGLVDRIFPDALYLHIVRDPRLTLPSMVSGWLNSDRFFTYDVPAHLEIHGYPENQKWNFALPPRWRDYTMASLEEVVGFQWQALQEAILCFANQLPNHRYMRIRLEDLTEMPDHELKRICQFIDIPYDSYLKRFSEDMPKVNAGTANFGQHHEPELSSLLERLAPMVKRLGY